MQGAPLRLRCEYLEDPLGIDAPKPRLSWCLGDGRPAELQTAYQVLAASDLDLLAADAGDFWDTGRVEGHPTSQIEYAGRPLTSGRSLWWKVRSFDSDGLPGPWSTPGFFEAGLLREEDWHGHWISAGLQGSRLDSVPVPLFGRQFELASPVRSARLYVAALGQAAIQLNGQRLGPFELAPNWVDYLQRVEYLTFDVGSLLAPGRNSLAVLLADGWYSGDPGTGRRQQYGDKGCLMLQLDVVLENGREFHLATDSTWRWQPSWILRADPTRGESASGRERRPNWLGGRPDTLGWSPVEPGLYASERPLVMTAASLTPVRATDLVHARPLSWEPSTEDLLFEFSRPIMGRAHLSVTAPAGGAIRLRYGLELDADGALVADAEDTFIATGDEEPEKFEAIFSLHGFKFVEVSGDMDRDAVQMSAVPIAQPLARASTMISDHPRINVLYDAMFDHLSRTQQSASMAGISRSDRLGRVAVFGGAAGALLRNFDGAPLLGRWLRDMADAQFPEGGFPAVMPAPPGEEALCAEGPAGSADSFAEVLWQLYRHCGDRHLLRQHFPAVKQMLAGCVVRARDFIREDLDSDTPYPADLAATAWLFKSARLASRIAGVLGSLSDLGGYEALAKNVRQAFRKRFVTADGRVIGDDVPVYALALGCGLLDPAEHRLATSRLFEMCEGRLKKETDPDVPLLAVPGLLPVLTDLGRLDLAYRIVLEAPFSIKPGAGGRDVGKLVSAGLDEWLFRTLVGFNPSPDLSEHRNAFRHMLIRPRPPLGLGFTEQQGEPPVRAVEAGMTTINGRYELGWQMTEEAFELSLTVPGNCSASIVLPDGTGSTVAAGSYQLSMKFGAVGDGIPVLREVS